MKKGFQTCVATRSELGMTDLVARLAGCLDSGGVRLSDGTLIGVANHPAAGDGASSPASPLRLRQVAAPVRLRRPAGAVDHSRGLPQDQVALASRSFHLHQIPP